MLKVWNVCLPALTGEEERRAYVYVPDGVEGTRYPVLYMFDGHNLFRDADATYGKSWGMSEYLAAHGVPLMVAAVECSHHPETDPCGGRLSEYSPFDFSDPHWGEIRGRGALTMEYYVNFFKPYIDAHYPTLPDREHTFIGGSSMGGLMAIWGLLAYGHIFSRAAALSPALSFSPREVKAFIRQCEPRSSVLYMDAGETELSARSRKLYADVAALLVEKGVLLTSRIIPGGFHAEASWEKQLPFFVPALLYDLEEGS